MDVSDFLGRPLPSFFVYMQIVLVSNPITYPWYCHGKFYTPITLLDNPAFFFISPWCSYNMVGISVYIARFVAHDASFYLLPYNQSCLNPETFDASTPVKPLINVCIARENPPVLCDLPISSYVNGHFQRISQPCLISGY